ncbi:hypothetical protein [Gynurincola endophyticus]|uniref:hypothetical protein n=1 Tax=Gynurincola endophyticus TaxID=2479004 RepID=UPI000F8F7A8F|nr:hypothetical protein [Gynurincola endophyticus]
MRKLSYLFLLAIISLVGCTKDKDDDNNNANFQEGKIELEVTFTNPLVAKFFNSIENSSKHPAYAYDDAWSNLTSEENNTLGNLFEDNWSIVDHLYRSPIFSNDIYIKGNIVRLVGRGIAHETQNIWNTETAKGNVYVARTFGNGQSMSFSYESDFLPETGITLTTGEGVYVRTEGETSSIEGYPVKKVTYTAKPEFDRVVVQKLELYVAADINKGINLLHPFYFEENGGILKIEVGVRDADFGKIIYEMKNFVKRNVSTEEITNAISDDVVNTGDDDAANIVYEKFRNITSFIF